MRPVFHLLCQASDSRSLAKAKLRPRTWAGAFTIVEAAMATIIVGVMFVAALNTVGTSRLTQHRASLVERGQLLARLLTAEIVRQSYKDPEGTPVFGRETNEPAVPRTTWDDVDDYEGLSETPPLARDGTALTNFAGWKWTVKVQWVDPADPSVTKGADSGAKRITVTVTYKDVPQAVMTVLRTDNL
jgi:type II secretory pathway pseudopilin PulG